MKKNKVFRIFKLGPNIICNAKVAHLLSYLAICSIFIYLFFNKTYSTKFVDFNISWIGISKMNDNSCSLNQTLHRTALQSFIPCILMCIILKINVLPKTQLFSINAATFYYDMVCIHSNTESKWLIGSKNNRLSLTSDL